MCAAKPARCWTGFTLLELLAALAIVAIVAAVAVPWYRGYMATAREGALGKRIAAMAIFQEETRLRTGSYGAGSWDPVAGEESLAAAIGWQPATDDGTTFTVTADRRRLDGHRHGRERGFPLPRLAGQQSMSRERVIERAHPNRLGYDLPVRRNSSVGRATDS